jgi:hypothetical protein
MRVLYSTNRQAIVDAEAKISSNMGLPCHCNPPRARCYYTVETKYNPVGLEQDIYFILYPSDTQFYDYDTKTIEAYSVSDMMNGVDLTDISDGETDSTWFPPQEL